MKEIYEKYMDEYEEVVKHKKRKIKESPKKADHKHEYKEFIGVSREDGVLNVFPVDICQICKKKKRKRLFFFKRLSNRSIALLTTIEQVKEHYPELEVREIETQWFA